jgi:hypothetical protein
MDDPAKPLDDAEILDGIWERFREGQVVLCPSDAAPMALSVDASVGVYRFVCTRCGVGSAWFEAGTDGLRPRGYGPPVSVRGGPVDE